MGNNPNYFPPVFLQSGDPETESVGTLKAPGTLGAKITKVTSDGVKGYQLVQTDSGMAVAPYSGAVAWWANQAAYLVTTNASTPGRGRAAGVFRRAWRQPGDYMCVQYRGYCPNVKGIDALTASPSVAGLFVVPSATNAKADVLAAGSAPTYPPLGKTAGTLNLGDNTFAAQLDLPDTF